MNGNVKYMLIAVLFCCLGACQSAEPEKVNTASAAAETYRPVHQQPNDNAAAGDEKKEQTKAAPVKPVIRETAAGDMEKSAPTLKVKKILERVTPTEKGTPAARPASGLIKTEPTVAYQAATVWFADGSAAIAPEHSAEIRRIAQAAKKKKAHITVYGFSSSRTRNTDIATHQMINFKISLKRAENVAAALIRAGVPRGSVAVEALSDSQPLYQEVMPEGERLNRRAEIYISY